MTRARRSINLDTLGVCASTLCLVHCMAFPLLVTATAFLSGDATATGGAGDCGTTSTNYWIHAGLLGAVAPIGMTAWGCGYRRHRDASILILGGIGLLLLVGALLFGHHMMDGRGEQILTLSGSIAMVSAHLLNRRRCDCPHACESQASTPLAWNAKS